MKLSLPQILYEALPLKQAPPSLISPPPFQGKKASPSLPLIILH